MLEDILSYIEDLKWDPDDDIEVQVGGCAVTGTATHPDANPKWSKPCGTVTYQNDAFIVIKNKSRNPVVSSQPNPEIFKPHHKEWMEEL
jgi:hypothetical protein